MEHHTEDGRDEDDAGRIAAPPIVLGSPEDDPNQVLLSQVGTVRLMAVNKAMILQGHRDEAVPNCSVRLGPMIGKANEFGNVDFDISTLPDGVHPITVHAPHTSNDEVGPSLGIPDGATHVWAPFESTLKKSGAALMPPDGSSDIDIFSGRLRIALRPLWIAARAKTVGGMQSAEMVVIHHTAGLSSRSDLNALAYGSGVSAHYLIPPTGEVIKLVREADRAWHAGLSHWLGREALNKYSIGIEITHNSGDYPQEQIDAVETLLERILAASPGVPVRSVVAHSDIALNDRERRPPKTLNRKSGDPSSRFPWERLEARGWGLNPIPRPFPTDFLGGYFQHRPNGALQRGDRDSSQTFGGEHLPEVERAVQRLQEALNSLGYFVGQIDGDFGVITFWAVKLFQQRMFSGSRRRGSNPENSGDGRCDAETAKMLNAVAGTVG